MRQISAGFSLLEVIISLSVVGVIATIAIPAFGDSVANGQIRTEVNALFHAIHVARKESAMRRTSVSICPSANGTTCSRSLNWSSGWIMFNNLDRDEPPQLDPGEALLQNHRASDDILIQANRRGFTLRPIDKRATNGTIRICHNRARGTGRALIVSYTGRPRVATVNSRGERYTCQS